MHFDRLKLPKVGVLVLPKNLHGLGLGFALENYGRAKMQSEFIKFLTTLSCVVAE